VTWVEPYDGGSPITGYQVLFSQNQITMPDSDSLKIHLHQTSMSSVWTAEQMNTVCAAEEGSCECYGTVYYTSAAGSIDSEALLQRTHVAKDVYGTVVCENNTFGSDPASGEAK